MTSASTPRKALKFPAPQQFSRIHGVGSYRPERVITNDEVATWHETSDEWIRSRSGVAERRWARPDETVIDMAEAAGRDALAKAGVAAEQIDAVLVANVTHPFQTPAAATAVADRLGAKHPAAFDLSAACAGYCYGIGVADAMVRAGTATYVLVIGVEKLSDFTSKTDRGTAFIFADGAGAAVVGPSDFPGIGPTVWGSEGEHFDVIKNKYSWTQLRDGLAAGDDTASITTADGGQMPWAWLTMQGPSVFRWAVYSMAPIARKAMEAAGVTVDDLDAFIPHQANIRIIDSMCKELGIPKDLPVARDIVHQGNTSAASVPLATDRMLTSGEAPHGGIALQFGFGAGLVYAAQVIVLP